MIATRAPSRRQHREESIGKIDRAVRRYVEEETRANLRKHLARSDQAHAEFDNELAAVWFRLEGEVWRRENH